MVSSIIFVVFPLPLTITLHSMLQLKSVNLRVVWFLNRVTKHCQAIQSLINVIFNLFKRNPKRKAITKLMLINSCCHGDATLPWHGEFEGNCHRKCVVWQFLLDSPWWLPCPLYHGEPWPKPFFFFFKSLGHFRDFSIISKAELHVQTNQSPQSQLSAKKENNTLSFSASINSNDHQLT